jgi:hypothetical protein
MIQPPRGGACGDDHHCGVRLEVLGMRSTWRRFALLCLVAGSAIAILVPGGSAGNRDGTATLVAVPGPGAVTYGQNIAYTATFSNDSGAVFTHVTFEMPAPTINNSPAATIQAFSHTDACTKVSDTLLTCDFGQLRPGDPAITVTAVWKVTGSPLQPGCKVDPPPNPAKTCLHATSTWLIKENKDTNGNETFDAEANADLIGASNDDSTAPSARQRAGGYELGGCTVDDPVTLSTDQSLDSAKNPVSTSFCLPSFTAGADTGLQSTITEPPSTSAEYARASDVCIVDADKTCSDPGHTFDDPITFTFRVADSALPKGYKITTVTHDGGVPLPQGACDAATGFCVVSINLDHKTKIWTLVVTSPKNGHFSW